MPLDHNPNTDWAAAYHACRERSAEAHRDYVATLDKLTTRTEQLEAESARLREQGVRLEEDVAAAGAGVPTLRRVLESLMPEDGRRVGVMAPSGKQVVCYGTTVRWTGDPLSVNIIGVHMDPGTARTSLEERDGILVRWLTATDLLSGWRLYSEASALAKMAARRLLGDIGFGDDELKEALRDV